MASASSRHQKRVHVAPFRAQDIATAHCSSDVLSRAKDSPETNIFCGASFGPRHSSLWRSPAVPTAARNEDEGLHMEITIRQSADIVTLVNVFVVAPEDQEK